MKPSDLASLGAAPGAPIAGSRSGVLTFLLVLAISTSAMPQPLDNPVAPPASRAPSTPLTYVSQGHVLSFAPDKVIASNGTYALQVAFEDANAVTPVGDAQAPAEGGKPAQLDRVTYANLWDGITLAYHAPADGLFESTYTLAPHADASAIRLHYNVPLAVSADGSLAISFATGQLVESAPVAWQVIDGIRRPVAASFQIAHDNELSFALGAYDRNSDLYIDPTVVWNTFLGGTGYDLAYDLQLDADGNIYVVGYSEATWGAPVLPYFAGRDGFVAKLSPTGGLVWNTFLGGSGIDAATGISLSRTGPVYASTYTIYVVGYSSARWGSPVEAYAGATDTFVASLASNGSLAWHTFLGGRGSDIGSDIAVYTYDGIGNPTVLIYVAGYSNATWGSPVRPFTPTLGDWSDAFVARVNTSGHLVLNTFLGGGSGDYGYALSLTGLSTTVNAVYVIGSSGAPWASPFRPFSGASDAFIAKLDGVGNLVWNTFLGGTGADAATGIANGPNGIYVVGNSTQTWGSPVRAYTKDYDAFVASVADYNGKLVWNTFLGAGSTDYGYGIALDDTPGYVDVTGVSATAWGCSSPGCTVDPFQGGPNDLFAARLSTSTGNLVWNTFEGNATSCDAGYALDLDGSGHIVAAGLGCGSWGLPVRGYSNSGDAAVIKFDFPAHSISGYAGVAGAHFAYTDGTELHATADNVGVYSFSVSYNWSGSVTPSKAGYTFNPSSKPYTNVVTNQTAQNYSATPITYNISGNAGVGGAKLVYTDGTVKDVTADTSGNYSLSVSYNWSGTVTPSKPGYTFNPLFIPYSNVLQHKTGQNYTATLNHYTISGNAGVAGATLKYTDGTQQTVTSNASGYYFLIVPYNWSGTVTPSKAGYTFDPPFIPYTNVQQDKTGQDYIARPIIYHISGSTGVGGVILNYVDGTQKRVTSDPSGMYSLPVSYNWSGRVMPSKASYIFSPPSRSYANVLGDKTGENYTATHIVIIKGNAGVAGARLTWGTAQAVTADAAGAYSITAPYNWSGTVTPSKLGYSFSPPNRPYLTPVTTNQTAQNYEAYFPSGTITNLKPVYTWTKIANAAQYRYEVWSGGALKHTHTVSAIACGASPVVCSNLPAETLTYTTYKWHVQAFVNGAWQPYKPWVTFTIPLKPKAGFWKGINGDLTFYVAPDQTHVTNFKAVFRNLCAMSFFTRTYPGPLVIKVLTTHDFSFASSTFYGNGKFTAPLAATGKAGAIVGSCNTGLYPWAATWLNSNQP